MTHLKVIGPIFKAKMGPIGCPETLVQNYHSVLRKISEGSRSR